MLKILPIEHIVVSLYLVKNYQYYIILSNLIE